MYFGSHRKRKSPPVMFDTGFMISKKVDTVKALELFSYLQNCQDPGLGRVEQAPKTYTLISTGNGSSPIFTKLGVHIPYGASTNPWNFEPCGSNHSEGTAGGNWEGTTNLASAVNVLTRWLPTTSLLVVKRSSKLQTTSILVVKLWWRYLQNGESYK